MSKRAISMLVFSLAGCLLVVIVVTYAVWAQNTTIIDESNQCIYHIDDYLSGDDALKTIRIYQMDRSKAKQIFSSYKVDAIQTVDNSLDFIVTRWPWTFTHTIWLVDGSELYRLCEDQFRIHADAMPKIDAAMCYVIHIATPGQRIGRP